MLDLAKLMRKELKNLSRRPIDTHYWKSKYWWEHTGGFPEDPIFGKNDKTARYRWNRAVNDMDALTAWETANEEA